MPEIISLILFLTCLYGFGYSLTRFAKTLSWETVIMRLGLGLAACPVVGVILNVLNIPLDWRIFLVLALSFPLFDIVRRKMNFGGIASFNINGHFVGLVIIFIFCLACYCYGPFTYPWLEDDDPWCHAASIKYVALEKDVDIPSGIFPYLNPYPPGYAVVLGVLHQTSPSLYWTMKFFNGVIVALGILFFYFFAKRFSGDKNKALLATFFLASVPCYLSHFIWAHSLAVTLFLPAFYFLIRAKDDKCFLIPSGVVVGGILLTQPDQPIKFFIMALLWFGATWWVEKKIWKRLISALLIGSLLSFIWYSHVIQEFLQRKLELKKAQESYQIKDAHGVHQIAAGLFSPAGGSTTKKHAVYHYLFPPEHNDRNNPVGVGLVMSFFILLGIARFFRLMRRGTDREKIYATTILLWLVFTFLGCNTKTFNLPIGLFAYRFWALFAIPSAFLAGEALWECTTSVHKKFRKTLLIISVVGVVGTSAYPKFVTNTDIWNWGVLWNSAREMRGYLWMRYSLPSNTQVFAFTDNYLVLGHDMRSDYWTKTHKGTLGHAMDLPPAELREALRDNGFECVVISERDMRRYGRKAIKDKVTSIKESNAFEVLYEIPGSIWVYRVHP